MSDILLIINFFFIALALLFIYYYSVQLRLALKKAREQHALAEQFRTLFNKTVEGVVQTDPDGNVKLVNDAGARMFGYANGEEMVRESVNVGQFYLYPEQRAEVRRRIFDGGLQDFRLDIKTRTGKPTVISMSFHPLKDGDGKAIGIEGIFRDVSDRVRIEKQLQEYSENLEDKVNEKTDEVLALERKKFDLEKLAIVGQMASTLVHELRNPLSSIKMGLTTLIRRVVLLDQDKHILDVSIREVAHLERILKDILDFARPQKLKFIIQPINQIIQIAIDRMAELYRQANITIESNLATDVPPIALDMDKIIQVLVNLLINAKDAMKSGGCVTVRSSLISDGQSLLIEVEDDGKGIPADAIDHLFNPFYSRKSGGTGLGLTVVEKFVSVHGGKVKIESEEGKGTLVIIELPVDSELSKSEEDTNQGR
ncbi:PAS domain S-box protein [candidate division KSB1 bacterium]|nr:PAS domain S-box protein [candidate division KSB1 bacterium]